jgi:hypothetical protein
VGAGAFVGGMAVGAGVGVAQAAKIKLAANAVNRAFRVFMSFPSLRK